SPLSKGGISLRWQDGYTVGRDAGRLNLSTPTAIFEGDILADTVTGQAQTSARPSDVTDGYKLSQTTAPRAGTLALGLYTATGLTNAYNIDVKFADVAAITAGLNASGALPADRASTAWFDASALNKAGLGGLDVATKGNISVDASLTFGNGAKIKLVGPIVDIKADITARAGSVTVTNIFRADGTNVSPVALTAGGEAALTLHDDATIDTRGLWTNGVLNRSDLSGLAYLNGGTVDFRSTQDVTIASGSVIDVSSGGAILPTGKTRGGTGGNVTLFAYDELSTSSAGSRLVLDGDIRGYGVHGGGTLAVDGASIVVGARNTSHASTDLLLTPELFRKGFSKYDFNGHEKLSVADGTVINVEMPVYRFNTASFSIPTGVASNTVLEPWTPPQYLEDSLSAVLTQRAGADVVLESNNLLKSGQIDIGKNVVLSVDPGRAITVQSPGQITIEGALRAAGGEISVIQMNTASEKGAPANPTPGQKSIWIGDYAVLDVAARAVRAIDSNGLRYGVVPNGGSITIGAPTKRENGDGVAQAAEAFIVIRPGALLDASGTSAAIDIPTGPALSRASTPVTVASNGGSIALNSFNGLYLDGIMKAASGGANASGGTLLLTLETARYKSMSGGPAIPDDVRYIRELVIGQNYETSGSDMPLKVGTGRISVEQIASGGFDTLSAYADVVRFDGNVNLSLGRELELYQAALTSDGAKAVRLAAPHIVFKTAVFNSLEGNPVYPKVGGGTGTVQGAAPQTTAALTVDADLIDLYTLQLAGVTSSLPVQSGTRPFKYFGFDTATLNSRGDIRLVGGVTGSRVLELNAAQIYPVTGSTTTIMATDLVRFGRIGGDTPDLPYSVFGKLNVYSKAIEQGGVLRAPLGKITLGSSTTVGTPAPPITETVTLLPGSITSVSGNGLVIPYGGTVDDVSYFYNGVKVTAPIETYGDVATGVVLAGKSFNVAAGALIDLSGGGDVRGGGFISGRGGSVDVLATALANANPGYGYSSKGNQVYAIVPGAQRYAPIDTGAGAAPGIGRTITIPEGVPGLKAGTYTLMPARYALMPGAYRVEIGGTTTRPYGAIAAGNGSWLVSGYQGVANTGVKDTLPTQMIVTPGDTVRTYSQYNETGYADFLVADAVRLGAARPILPIDGKTLYLNYAVQPSTTAPALVFDGKALFTPAEEGYGGILRVDGNNFGKINLEIVASGAPHTAGFVSIEADELNAIGAVRMSLGSFQNFIRDLNYIATGGFTNSLVVRAGAKLQAPEIFLGATQGGVTIEDGVKIATLGQSNATPFSAADGYSYNLYDSTTNILAMSNGLLDLLSLGGASGGSNAGIKIGKAELYTEGTLLFATGSGGKLALDRGISYGAKYLSLVVPTINIGENAAIDAALSAGVLPDGLVLNQQVLASLLQGNQGLGVPKVETLLLSAGGSINVFGSVTLDTIDPATGKSSLAELVLNTPAIYGLGDADAHAKITTGTLIWNGVSDGKPRNATSGPASLLPPAVVANGPGSGHGTLDIVADEIVFGYPKFTNPDTQLTLDRLALGFSTVNLTASQRITANNHNSLAVYHTGTDAASYAGGDLNLITPLLTGEGASINRITAGGALTLSAPAGSAAARTDVTGAEIGLKAQSVSVASTIALPSGKLTIEAEDALTLTDDARIDMAGRAITMIDVVKYSWGGDVILTSNHGDVTQAAGAVIDLSAQNNNAGTLAVTAVDATSGGVDLRGSILGSATGQQALGGTVMPYDAATIDVRAQTIADFTGLNRRLTRDEVFGGRSFQIKKEGFDLVIGDELKANSITLSVDGGRLTVNGRVDASGFAVGTIRLGARDGLTLASTAVLDAHGTRLRVDSYGQPIDAPNRAVIELTSSGPGAMLTLASGATIDVRSADAVARGTVTLNAPRVSETGGDIAIDARGPLNISGAKSIAVSGFWRYTDAPAGTPDADGTPTQIVNQAYLDAIHGKSTIFIGNALDNADLQGRLGGLKAYGAAYHLRPGVEIASATKDGNLTIEGDLDLSGYRYGLAVNPAIRGSGEPGMLVLRAGGDLTIKGSINDGFGVPPVTGAGAGRDVTGLLTEDYTTTEVVVLQGSMYGGATTFPTDTGLTLNFDAPMANPGVKAGVTIPFEFVGNEGFAYYLPDYSDYKPWTTTAPIWGPDGSLLYAAGAVVRGEIPFRSRYGAGTFLPYDPFGQYMMPTFGTLIVPRGTPLNIFDETYGPLSLAANITLPTGAIVPKGTNVVGVIGTITPPPDHPTWSIAPMLAAGSQSWSMRLASGADVTAADSRVLRAVKAGNLVLNDLHLVGPAKDQPNISVIRTGTGDLELLAGGNFEMKSLFGVYTAGTQSADIGANGSDPFNQPRGLEQVTNPAGGATVLGSVGSAYESLVKGPSSLYQAWYPEQGGNLLVTAQGDITGYTTTAVNDRGKWLWRQGGDISGLPTAWWVNFGTYTYGASLIGFGGFGALGGGNVIVTAGGNAGQLLGMGESTNPISQGLNIVVGSTGRIIGGQLVQTGGGDLTLKVGGAINPLQPSFNHSSNLQNDEGVIANLRGAINVSAGAIGRIDLTYGWSRPLQFNADPRPVDPRSPNFAASAGGPVLFVGDAAASLTSRGDLVLTKADDPGRTSQSNTTPYKLTQNGVTTSYGGGGTTWFSLWTNNTTVDLFAAGGNLTPVALGNTSSTDYPATLRAVAAEGSIYYGVLRDNLNPIAGSVTLAPSAVGQLEILARDSIYTLGMPISMSGADPAALPTPFRPAFIGYTGGTAKANNLSPAGEGVSPSSLYAFGPNTVTGNLHAGDDEPQRFYAVEGDIVGLRTGEIHDLTKGGSIASPKAVNTWYVAAKPVRIIAGRDIVGSGEQPYAFDANGKPFYPAGRYNSYSLGNILYHPDADDVSVISAGRDILYANFQVAGPGALEVSAGRNIYQADKGSITSIGPLASGDSRLGASIIMQAGVGANGLDYAALAKLYLDPANVADPLRPLADQPGKVAKTYERDLYVWVQQNKSTAFREWLQRPENVSATDSPSGAYTFFQTLTGEQQNVFLRLVYFAELKAAGREYNDANSTRFGSYLRGREVIAALFPETAADGKPIVRQGDITLFSTEQVDTTKNPPVRTTRDSSVRTLFGGDIQMLAPGGQIVIGVEGIVPGSTAGVTTQGSGNIQMYSKGSILLGLSRIMTTFGGDILAWSAEGDINAGRGAKTTVVYTPPKRVYDSYGNVALSPTAPSAGAGIATLQPLPDVAAGDVDLIAPLGTIDAGEAGVRSSGNVNLAALQIVNAANIQAQGTTTGIPTVQAPNISGALTASNAAGAAAQQTTTPTQNGNAAQPSIIIVEVLGFGGEDGGSGPNSNGHRDDGKRGLNDRSGSREYNEQSAVQITGYGPLDTAQSSLLTQEEKRNLGGQ
ncbi:filamentous hemagglutinin family protein, partial [Microbacteriaceae bacterium K1510]|nr:filamentous hemagglutinin family protein [Microbacteriaceae bacterium K1510]